MAALGNQLTKIIPVSQQIIIKPTPTAPYPHKISNPRSQGLLLTRGNEAEDFPRFAPITSIWFEIVENVQPIPPPTKDFALRKKYVFTLD